MSKDTSGSYYDFQKLVEDIAKVTKHTEKTVVIQKFLKNWEGDVYHVFHLLLCRDDKRVYNVREKVFVKILSKILAVSEKEMITDLEQGDIGETTKKKKSTYTVKEVDDWLDSLTKSTKEDQQVDAFTKFLSRATADDLKYVSKIIDKDLKVFIGPRYALVALHPDAYNQYKITSDLKMIIKKSNKSKQKDSDGNPGLTRKLSCTIDLMTPVKPMLARPNKSLEDTWNRCPNGMIAEYDGERIQIHKNGDVYQTYSRSLKPVTPHKVAEVKDYIPQAFKDADTMILDGEILLVDSNTNEPLPFGTLGIHKKKAFADATVCLFLFDILYLNGETLIETPMEERRKILKEHIEEIPGRVQLTTRYKPKDLKELKDLFHMCVAKNLEGLVVKDVKGIYEPNARHWIKIKKEHFEGMGDSADLIVLGMYYGTGSKGGKMSVFLMGVFDEDSKTYKTVCKVGNGFTDKEIDRLQTAFKVEKIEKDSSRCPPWLSCSKTHMPDFVVKNPKHSSVWEIVGAEFSYSPMHTANKISIRFPRVSRYRDDKDWATATTLKELQAMYDLGGINRKTTTDDGEDNDEEQELKPIEEDTKKQTPPPKTKVVEKKNPEMKKKAPDSEEEDSRPTKKTRVTISGKVSSLSPKEKGKWMIIHCVDNSGRWPQRGAFAHISSKWEEAERVYSEEISSTRGGGIIKVKLPDAQKKANGMPPLDMAYLKQALAEVRKALDQLFTLQASFLAKEKKVASVHLPILHPQTPLTGGGKVNLDKIEDLLAANFPGLGLYIYDPWSPAPESKKRPREDEDETLEPASKKQKPQTLQPIFEGLTILSYGDTGINFKEITKRGGKIFSEDDDVPVEKLTHIITNNTWEKDLFALVLQESPQCKFVKPEWLTDSLKSQKLAFFKNYLVTKK